jgi:hypothetical protein
MMKAAARVAIITRSADALASRAWPTIDLILDQFGFETSAEWRGDEESYLIEHLKGGSDEALIELDAYLRPTEAPPTKPPAELLDDASSPWQTAGFRLFITHTSTQKTNVAKLALALRDRSVEAFVAHESIAPTEEWQRVIESALRSCDALLAWLHPGFRESDWCDQEVGVAIGRGILVIPVRFDLDPYGFIGRYQAVTVRDQHPAPEMGETIFEVCLNHELTRRAMARAIVARFAASDSFAGARGNISLLRRVPSDAWTSDLARAAREAAAQNSQISELWVGAGGGPNELENILTAAGVAP